MSGLAVKDEDICELAVQEKHKSFERKTHLKCWKYLELSYLELATNLLPGHLSFQLHNSMKELLKTLKIKNNEARKSTSVTLPNICFPGAVKFSL